MDNSSPKIYTEFLPISRADMEARGWDQLDFVVVGGDAYVDHPSFGTAIISRLLEAEGYKVGVLAQPRYTDCEDFKRFGKPKYGFFIGGGNVDSMVSHYSVAKIPRAEDEYSPGGKGGARPDRSATVYTKLAKEAYPDLPVILGGLEASLRRFAHYDYWMDTVLPSIAESSGADIISFGMGEHQTVEIARRLAAGEPVEQITDVDGTCYLTDFDHLPERYVECAGFKKVASDKTAYAKACRIQMDNQDVVSGQIIVQKQSEKYLVQNIPAKPLVRWELDKVYALPYTRRYHPIYEAMGGVPAIREVQFSIIQNRGCFGGCNFCAIQLHQGRRVTSRSADSIVEEAERMTHEPDFKGYIHDVGGPTANFRFPSCREQMLRGMCNGGKHCLAPTTCSHMIVDHSDYLKILRRVRELPGVKKVFIRSGIRFDYLMADPDDTFFKELVEYHVSGQLKVAPEHCAPNTLAYMGKPPIETFNKFKDKFYELSKKAGKKQYLVPQKSKRILLIQKKPIESRFTFRSALGGVLMQETDLRSENKGDFEVVTKKQPTEDELDDFVFAQKVAKHCKSNAVALVKDSHLLAVGVGQTSRVAALKQAIEKAQHFGFDLRGAVLASDAFFPFDDCVTLAAEAGVTAVVQPGGSMRDGDSIAKADELGLSMVFTGVRHFKH